MRPPAAAELIAAADAGDESIPGRRRASSPCTDCRSAHHPAAKPPTIIPPRIAALLMPSERRVYTDGCADASGGSDSAWCAPPARMPIDTPCMLVRAHSTSHRGGGGGSSPGTTSLNSARSRSSRRLISSVRTGADDDEDDDDDDDDDDDPASSRNDDVARPRGASDSAIGTPILPDCLLSGRKGGNDADNDADNDNEGTWRRVSPLPAECRLAL